MEFFCYHRDRPGSVTLREELLEEHWSYMDRYQAQMIARGPVLACDSDTPTGSDIAPVLAEFGPPAEEQPYRCEIELRDPDGNRLRISTARG